MNGGGHDYNETMPEDYESKRDFSLTPEPAAREKPESVGPLSFVVQKHAARQLHYDFRLEVDGALKSWAIAKGPSLDPRDKRLAVMVEDHPLEYAGFEGGIPKGQYGAGQVIVWDRGTYSPDEAGEFSFDDRAHAEERMRAGLADGKLSFTLRGEKMKGSWTLVRMQKSEKNWLLIKHRDAHAVPGGGLPDGEASVISGLTIEGLKAGRRPPDGPDRLARLTSSPAAAAAPMPTTVSPMLATLADAPFNDEGWWFEPKLDGYRVLAFLDHGTVKLRSRRGVDFTERFADVAAALQRQPAGQLVLDGEIIALDAKGKSCFQCLQGYLKTMGKRTAVNTELPAAVIYYVFDILFADGLDLTRLPLESRNAWLRTILTPDDTVRLVEHFPTDGVTVYEAAVKNGLEGVVGKRRDSPYEAGKRSNHWLKVKQVTSDEFVIGGFTGGQGTRAKTFGALLLGSYDDENKLRYAGKVGSGFSQALLEELSEKLASLARTMSPFAADVDLPDKITWVKPVLVAEVRYAERTHDGLLRVPIFLRLRDDKPAASVRFIPEADDPPANASGKQNDDVAGVLAQLDAPKADLSLDVAGYNLRLSNLDKPIWPAVGKQRALTKRDLISYLARVSPYLLPHLEDRPLTLSRYPHGINGEHFWQKHYRPVPEFVETVSLTSHDTPEQPYVLGNNLATLLWLGQIADIELHTWFSRVTGGPDFKAKTGKKAAPDFYADHPDYIIFDIDPYIYSGKEKPGDEPELNRAAFQKTSEIVLDLKKTLDDLSFPAYVKTSGKTGLHVFVPVLRQLDFHGTHAAAETIGKFLLQKHPAEVTLDWAVEKRAGRVFLDYNQNVRGKSLAAIYSPRPSHEATVSVPLTWDELGHVYPTEFTILNVPERLASLGDLWADIDDAKVDISGLLS